MNLLEGVRVEIGRPGVRTSISDNSSILRLFETLGHVNFVFFLVRLKPYN